MTAKFDPSQPFERVSQKFDPNQPFERVEEEKGWLQEALDTVDSYTGAPTRASVGALQNNKNPFKAFADQWGEDPALAPTPKQINAPLKISKEQIPNALLPDAFKMLKLAGVANPTWESLGEGVTGMAVDWTNLIPGVGPAKTAVQETKAAKAAIKAIQESKAIAAASKAADVAKDAVASVAPEIAKGALKYTLGNDPRAVTEYLKNPEAVNAMMQTEEGRDALRAMMRKSHAEKLDAAEAAKDALQETRGDLSAAKVEYDSAVANKTLDLKGRKATAEHNEQAAKAAYDNAVREKVYGLRENRASAKFKEQEAKRALDESYYSKIRPIETAKAPEYLDEALSDAIYELRKKTSEASSKAWDTLPSKGKATEIAKLASKVDEEIKALRIGNSNRAAGKTAEQAIARLEEFKNTLKDFKNVSPKEVKKIIQQLRDDAEAAYDALGSAPPDQKQKKKIAEYLDSEIKSKYDDYRKAMEPTADMTALLKDRGLNRIKNRDDAARFIRSIAGPDGSYKLEDIKELERLIGKPGRFTNDLKSYAESVRLMKNREELEALKRGLPEYQAWMDARSALDPMETPMWLEEQTRAIKEGVPELQPYLKNKEAADAMRLPNWMDEQRLQIRNNIPEKARLEAMVQRLNQAKESAELSKAELKKLGKVSEGSIDNTIDSLNPYRAKGVNPENLKFIEENFGTEVADKIRYIHTAESFKKPSVNGSRNTYFGSMVGLFFGGLPGLPGGAAIGRAIDSYGPKMGKYVLDAYLAALGKAKSAEEAFEKMQVPPQIKDSIREYAKTYGTTANVSRNAVPRPGTFKGVADQSEENERQPARIIPIEDAQDMHVRGNQ